jgi:iron complex transport system ATP-binding protein
MINLFNIQIGFKSKLFSIDELCLERGKLYTLIGKNGIGKSTFLKTIAEIIQPLEGKINWKSKLPKEQRIAFVSSKFDGVENLNTYDYISLGRAPYTNLFGKLNQEDKSIINESIDLLNLFHLNNKETIKLSDGERQIASIGRAITQNTELIILDEPTAFLDYENKVKIINLLSKIAKERNCCIIHSSHDIELSTEFSDFILIIQEEKLTQLNSKVTSKSDVIKLAFPSVNL